MGFFSFRLQSDYGPADYWSVGLLPRDRIAQCNKRILECEIISVLDLKLTSLGKNGYMSLTSTDAFYL